MADAKPTTTRPSRARTAKPAAAPTTAAPAVTESPANEVPRFALDLVYDGDTARYARFDFPAEYERKVTGKVYAPLGTTAVKVLIVGTPDPNA